jgi:hypothetical protein
MEASAEKYIEHFEKCSVRIPGQPELRVQAVSDESVEELQWCRSVGDDTKRRGLKVSVVKMPNANVCGSKID